MTARGFGHAVQKKVNERSITVPGPYFAGQQPSPCGHYYPDVLRVRDEKKPDGTLVRILDCSYCGRYEIPLEPQGLHRALLRKLNKNGFDVGSREDELAEIRQKELKRLSSLTEGQEKALRQLRAILEEAIKSNADAVEFEYVEKGLEVTYVYGHSGVGYVLEDRALESGIIQLIVERAGLQDRSRGVMTWTYGKKSYQIKVEEYDCFGESAFRLILRKARRKRA